MSIVRKQYALARGASQSEPLLDKTLETKSSGCLRPSQRLEFLWLPWSIVWSAALAVLVFQGHQSRAEYLAVDAVSLPPLRIEGKPARAHTQGLELAGGKYYVTARRDDVRPRRALLLRTDPTATGWDVWDITPVDAQGALTSLDHPGGMQSDGARLWIPVAESDRNGRAMVRAFLLADLAPGRPLKPVFEFPVSGHIGSVAVSTAHGLLFGASWDTEKAYVWDLKGQLQRTLSGDELEARGLGVVAGPGGRAGVAVQDWKVVGDRLYASGLFGSPKSMTVSQASRLCWFEHFLEPDFQRRTVTLPRSGGVELAREAMAVSGGSVYFLPADLGASNRLFRVALAEVIRPQSTTTSPSAIRN
jgi:hypothetical protein